MQEALGLWQEIKKIERSMIEVDSTSSINVALRLNTDADFSSLRNKIAEWGGSVKRSKRSHHALAVVPVVRVPELFACQELVNAELAKDNGVKPNYRIAAIVSISLLLMLLLGWIGYRYFDSQQVTDQTVSSYQIGKTPLGTQDLYEAGLTAYKNGEKQKALDYWRRLVAKEPKRTGPRMSLGWLLHEIGISKEAEEQFRAVLDIDPGNKDAKAALEVLERQEP